MDFRLKTVESTNTFSSVFFRNYIKVTVKEFLQRWGRGNNGNKV